jgi:hypothetical protein
MSLKNSSSTSVINFWDEVNGNKLSLFLELGSIALLHTQWIITTAKNEGQVLLCHQKIPSGDCHKLHVALKGPPRSR